MPGSGGARLAEALRVLSAGGHELDADQLLDVLWLAHRLPRGPGAPLHRERPEAGPPADGSGAGSGAAPLPRPAPEPDDPDLPDLTAPSLYAAARQPPAPEPARPRPDRDSRRAVPVRVPEEKALADELAIGRALRPLRRRRDSLHRLEIDEELTAAEFAQTGLADVVQRPVRERWLNLVLLVDDGLSMLLWHRLAAELRTLLERLGAFRVSRVLGLDAGDVRPRLHARPFRPDGPQLPMGTVDDSSGQTLLLVVSDGMGAAWRSGAMHGLLAERAARGPVAVVHALPSGMWESSGISAELWQATTRRIGGANSSWRVVDPVLPPGIARFEGVPVPVLAPDAASLGDWARLLASPGTTVELPLLVRPDQYGSAAAVPRDSGTAQHFRDAATPEAYRLAAHLAAVSPLSVPVMRLVQTSVPWPVGTSHLAEVFLGGLMRPHPAPVPGPLPAKHRIFDFSDESKTALLDAVPPAELLRTSRRIGRRLDELAGNSPDFPAWLSHPDGPARLLGSQQPFTSVERRLLARFGVSSGDSPAGAGPDAEPEVPEDVGGWRPLLPEDPRRLGDYTLRGRRRGRRTVVYQGFDAQGNEAALRMPHPGAPPVDRGLIEVEAEALARLRGQYAPVLLATGRLDSVPWLAMGVVADASAPQAQPPRLEEIFDRALTDGVAPFDTLRGLIVAFCLANALALCHVNGLVPVDFGASGVFVLRRTVVLADLSDCAVDGEYRGPGPVPTREDNVRSLGELLQIISSKAGWDLPGMPEGMHLWQGDTWEQLRRLVLRCLDPDPARRPAASEVGEVLGQYIARTRPQQREGAGMPAPTAPFPRTAPAALDLPPDSGTPGAGAARLRIARFGAARRRAEEQLTRLRVPMAHGRRLVLVGPYYYGGRATTTMVLGHLLAAVRGEPVLALDAAASVGSLDSFLTGRNRAVLRDLAALSPSPSPSLSYEEVRAHTTRLSSGLEVVAHRRGHFSPNPTHDQDYTRVLGLTAPYYSFVLSDWGPLNLGRSAEVVLDHADQLVVCCSTTEVSLGAAARLLVDLREAGRADMVDRAVVVVTEVDGPGGRNLPSGPAHRLGVDPARVVRVPFDQALQSHDWDLGRLRVATTEAFLDLAELVLPPAAEPAAEPGAEPAP
ncbi:SAV_2336 N-terminal domain-related protein [Streptomyces sp. NPDC015184]|uniref:SAV_2336 N-terminal domain-related protein n=1 Tax=Streptomyces sp. NPDC015184 TaxID=3364946 RepID=UPI0036FD387E